MKFLLLLLFVFIFCFYSPAQWNQANIPSQFSSFDDFQNIDFVNDSVGFVSNSSGPSYIIKTTDYGINWLSVGSSPFIGYFDKIDFTSDVWGYALRNDLLIRTTNGGNSWTQLKSPTASQENFSDLFFNSSSTGYFISKGFTISPTKFYGFVYKTSNFGINWSVDTIPDMLEFNAIYFPSQDTGFSIGRSFPNPSGMVVKTYDGGNTWIKDTLTQIGELIDLHFVDNQTGYLVGASAPPQSYEIAKTTDGGVTWSYLNVPSGGPTTLTEQISAVHFISADTGYVAGNNNRFFKTVDGGVNWTAIPYMGTANDLYFTSNKIGFLAGEQKQLLSTNPGILTSNNNLEFSQQENTKLFPNPASEKITLKVNHVISNSLIEVRNNMGQLVLSKTLILGESTINVESLSSGLYYVSLNNGKSSFTEKLFIFR